MKRVALALLSLLLAAPVKAAPPLPIWTETFVAAKDGHSYAIQEVGRSPFYNGARTITVPVSIVPLIFTFSDGTVFDPTQPDPCLNNLSAIDAVLQSPIFQPSPISINGIALGQGQLIDEYQRANFYTRTTLTRDKYHTVLQPTVAPAVAISVPAGSSQIWQLGGCTDLGAMDWAVMYPIWSRTIAPLLDPSRLTVFITANAVMIQNGLFEVNCCDYGWHSVAYNSAQQPMTYVMANYDSTGVLAMPDIMTVGHEIAEWMDDPFVNNFSPTWYDGVANFYQEVADPLDFIPFIPGGIQMANGLTYHPQQLAFFSWFYGGPSIGAAGAYSAAGNTQPAFTSPASP